MRKKEFKALNLRGNEKYHSFVCLRRRGKWKMSIAYRYSIVYVDNTNLFVLHSINVGYKLHYYINMTNDILKERKKKRKEEA
jgi:hypothetical protein